MSNLLSKLSGTVKNKPIEPREIFMTLPTKSKRYEYPRDVQTDVWKKWFDRRNQKNNIIKMNTGSGKTVVGLMILQSCLNEGKGPSVYVAPDNYLVEQVCNEARELGILTATDEKDYKYNENKAILVINIHKLVNGKSVFGMSSIRGYPIGSIIIDDVHACLDTITTQFSLHIPAEHELYSKMLGVFGQAWKSYNDKAYIDIVEMHDPQKIEILPFWIWQEKQHDIYRLLREYDNEQNEFIYFNLPLIENCLPLCSCVITSRNIEIMPKGISISNISSFENATRRIFMSATLSDDGVFVSALGLKKTDITDIITPEKANDIGDRLMLFPTHLNKCITEEEIKSKVVELSKDYNVVVIVPSYERGKFWDDTGKHIINKENINSAVVKLKAEHIGLLVFVNRYDGVDLPDNACRILVIDGLPPLRTDYDKYVQSVNSTSNILEREQIQKIEQGMGRGVRSNSDSCCVVLMGNQLADVLIRGQGVSYFSKATFEQYRLSKELWDLLINEKPEPTIDDVFELADYSLKRELEWVEKSKERLSTIAYNTIPNINETTVILREAFDNAFIKQYRKAAETMDKIINIASDSKTKGYLMQIKAEYTNFFDCSKAQQILRSAHDCNLGVLNPINGIQYDKLINNKEQVKSIIDFINNDHYVPNQYVIYINSILDGLVFSPNYNQFENCICELGKILGFKSSRPEQEIKKGPDNLWAIGNGKYIVIECKSGTITDSIDKRDCNQLAGSVNWFYTEYKDSFSSCTPVMIHNSNVFDYSCSPPKDARIITPHLLESLKQAVQNFVTALVQNDNWKNENKINDLLMAYKLCNNDIVEVYSSSYKVKNS